MTEGSVCTDRERELLRAIVSETARLGYSPTVRELGEKLGIASTAGTIDHLRKLAKKGLVTRDIATARSLKLTPAGEAEIGMRSALRMNEAMREKGKRGGKARAAKMTVMQRKFSAWVAARSRWSRP